MINKKQSVLLIDKTTSDVIHCLITAALHPEERRGILGDITSSKNLETTRRVLLELSRIRHEGGWCTDPNCTLPQKIAKMDKQHG